MSNTNEENKRYTASKLYTLWSTCDFNDGCLYLFALFHTKSVRLVAFLRAKLLPILTLNVKFVLPSSLT